MTSLDPAVVDLVSLAGKTALVTGAAGGIGAEITRVLRAAGAFVLGVDLPGQAAPAASRALDCDLGDRAAIAALFADVAATAPRLDVLVHAAGIRKDGVLWKLADEDWDAVLRVNLDSAFHLLRGAVPLMREGGGAIVLISSINGERGKFGQANYAAAKAGLIGLGRTAARELGRFGIRVNMIAPGMIRTPMTTTLAPEFLREAEAEAALGRLGAPLDVAAAVLFLASAMGRHVTGQVLRVDGGQLMA
jgi:NAD(P)-dependent dehydrogenase (short-subunit alcohol dehydrogenase family)